MKPITERFWSKVHKTDGCWLWTGGTHPFGYGQLNNWKCRYPGGPILLAHRLSYEWAYGPIPDGVCVLHHCDNPACVRPDHLFLGTKQDNSQDMAHKNRVRGGGPYGENNHKARLTDDQVREIRALYQKGSREFGSTALARRYGVSQGAIWQILVGNNWKHVA